MPKRIDKLTPEQTAAMEAHADKWIAVGLRTGPADREKFERAVAECYRFAGLQPPKRVVWTTSPLAVAFAGPIASHLLERRGDAVDGAVDGAVGVAVRDAVDDAVGGAVGGAVRGGWYRHLGGQFWVGGWFWGPAFTSFFREVCELELSGDLWDRGRAYEATVESACWWWPHRDFVIVSERPLVIHRELVDPARPRGWGSHRLHCDDGPAIVWPDGWGVWAHHGVRVPQQVIEHPETLTPEQIIGEPNAEVRRVMMERHGYDRLLQEANAAVLHEDTDSQGHPRRLLRLDVPDDEPIVMVQVTNSSPEPDGSHRVYMLRVHPDLRPLGVAGARAQKMTCEAAVASTFGMRDAEYELAVET